MTEQEWLTSKDPIHALPLAAGRVSLCCGAMWCRNNDGTMQLAKGHRKCGCCDSQTTSGFRAISSDRKLRLFACACCRQIWHLLTDERSRKAVETAERYADSLATGSELAAAWDAARDAARDAAWATAGATAWDAARDAAWDAAWATARATARDAAWDAARDAAWDAAGAVQSDILRDIIGNPLRPLATESDYLGDTAMQDRMVATRRPGERNARSRLLPDAWLTPTVQFLAQAAYEERCEDGTLDAVRLSILADALEEAGCSNEELMRHLRGQTRCPRHETDLLRCRRCDSVQDRQFCPTHPALGHAVCGLCQAMEPLEPCPCAHCKADGWVPLPGPHYLGCWALDLVLGKE